MIYGIPVYTSQGEKGDRVMVGMVLDCQGPPSPPAPPGRDGILTSVKLLDHLDHLDLKENQDKMPLGK